MRVILRYDDLGAVDHELYGRYATITSGAPGRCPSCEEFGFIEGADLARHVQSQRCRSCGCQWSYEFDADGAILEVVELVPARVLDLTDGTRRETAAPLQAR